MTTEIQDANIQSDLQDLEIETFKVEELIDLDQNAADFSACSSTTSSTTSSSCG